MLGFAALSELALGEAAAAAPPAGPTTQLSATTRVRWSGSAGRDHRVTARFGRTEAGDRHLHAPWASGQARGHAAQAPWVRAQSASSVRHAPWSSFGAPLRPTSHSPWLPSTPTDRRRTAPWGRYEHRLLLEPRAAWTTSTPSDRARRASWGAYGPLLALRRQAVFSASAAADLLRWIPWSRFSRALAPGWGVPTPGFPGPLPEAALYILPARFYMTQHSFTVERVSDSAPVHLREVTISADEGSFAWVLTGIGPRDLFDQLAPTGTVPAQLRVTIDGLSWVFIVEGLRESGEFAKRSATITGRSATALIGAPWRLATMRSNDEARTAQQLAGEALEFTGVDLDWGITDWLVPAGAWNHQGTPLAAVQSIAEAAGGYVLSHREDATLLVRHPYQVAPWDWSSGVADVELPPDVLITTSNERRDGPDINGVYVSGTTHGVLALVKRTATAGDKLASLVTDPLITHVDVARQRGLSIVGTAGAKVFQTVNLPVLTGPGEPGVLEIGQLVQVNDTVPWRGRVRAVSVRAQMPRVRQDVMLERRL